MSTSQEPITNGAPQSVALTPSPSSSQLVRVDSADTGGAIAAFASRSNFAAAQRMAMALAASNIVPTAYRGNEGIGNCLVALELASRINVSVLMVMQNLYIIQGRPSWSSQFLIGSVNTSGRFTPLRFQFKGEPSKPGWGCRAYATEKATGEKLEGTWITWEMAQAEGWVTRKDSKWKTIPEQMIVYRAAAFWTRMYAPEISLGMHSADEMEEVGIAGGPSAGASELNAALRGGSAPATEVIAEPDIPAPGPAKPDPENPPTTLL